MWKLPNSRSEAGRYRIMGNQFLSGRISATAEIWGRDSIASSPFAKLTAGGSHSFYCGD